MKLWRSLTRIEIASLCLRILIWAFVASTGHWVAGDSLGFMGHSVRFCAGDFFGGDSTKSPLYTLFACIGSLPTFPFVGPLVWKGVGFAAAIFFQTVLVWAAGVYVRKSLFAQSREGATKFWQVAYHFDPVLLVYSSLLMSDALFAALLLIATLQIARYFHGSRWTPLAAAATGAIFAFIVLQRSLGMVWVAWTIGFVFIFYGRSLWVRLRRGQKMLERPASVAAMFFLVFGICLAPRIVYQRVTQNTFSPHVQGQTWLPSVAAAVAASEQRGLSFKEAEDLWNREHPNATWIDALETFKKYPASFAKLVVKGLARTTIGHVNVEIGLLLTGKTVFGPAWFKNQEKFTGEPGGAIYLQEKGLSAKIFWLLGILAVVIWMGWVYFFALRSIIFFRTSVGAWVLAWASGVVVIMCSLPLIFGDARFRLGYFPVLLVLWGLSLRGKKLV